MPNSYDLRGKSALLTGGAGDIGRAIATLLLESGARVRVWDVRPVQIAGVESDLVDITDAAQIAATLEPLAAAYNLRVTTIFGGVPQGRQVAALKSGVDIVVACPGRLEDLMRQRLISLDSVQITVIDEADHMADLGFLPGVTRILAATPNGGQRMLFSATLDNGVDKLVKRFLRNEVLHSVDGANSPVPAMTHHVFHVSGVEAKKELVHRLASGTGRRILFMLTKHQARKLAKQLTESGVPAVDLHGNLSQPARDRNLHHQYDARCF